MQHEAIVGTWTLLGVEARDPGGRVSWPFGKAPAGQLVYTACGHVSVMLMGEGRARETESVEAKARAFDSFLAYAGRYELLQDRVVHHPEVSLVPDWVGQREERFFEMRGNRLVLRTSPMGGMVYEITWERVRAAAPSGLVLAGDVALDHVAIATSDIVGFARVLSEKLGGRLFQGGEYSGESDPFRGGQWLFPGGGKLELLESLGDENARMRKFLGAHGARVHHACFVVASLPAAIARARRLGFDVTEGRDLPGWSEAYLSPRQTFGLLLQLVDAASDDAAVGLSAHWPGFPAMTPSSTPATITALDVSVKRVDDARRLFAEVLGAEVDERGAHTCFRWSGSSIEIRVTANAGAREGASGIVVAGANARHLAELPAGVAFRVAEPRAPHRKAQVA